MNNSYGYFKTTEGKDGDEIDVFLGEDLDSPRVFVVDQVVPDSGEFDESKVMLGFNDINTAERAYLSNYSADWKGLGSITEVDIDSFKEWLLDGKKQRKEFKNYKV